MNTPIIYVTITFFIMLLGIISFFLKQLLTKFDRVEVSINQLNEKIAVIMANQDHYQKNMEQRVAFESRIDKEIKDMRDSMHSVRNIINGVNGKVEILSEMKMNCMANHE